MAEFLTMSEADDKYASKAKGNTGIALGIIGTALGLTGGNGILSGLFGNSNPCGAPTPYELQAKQAEDNVALTSAIWQSRVTDLQEKFDLYTRLSDRLNALEKTEAATAAALPLMFQLSSANAERYADDRLHRAEVMQNAINYGMQNELSKKVNGTMGVGWSQIISGVPQMPACTLGVTCPTSA